MAVLENCGESLQGAAALLIVARMKVRPDLAIETGTTFAPGRFVLPP